MDTTTRWHVFTDGQDDWYDTIKEATLAFKTLCKEKDANIRLYEETAEVDGDVQEEHYLDGQGGFPY